jgi:protein tyrosine/serine phosphatase
MFRPRYAALPTASLGWAHFMRLSGRQYILATVICGAALSASAVAWDKLIKPRVTARKFGVIETGTLYRSGQLSRHVVEDVLVKNKIETIIFLSEDKADRPDVEAEIAAAQKLGITRLNFPINGDGTGDINQYANAIEVMVRSQAAGKPVLVHCHSGSQRTGAAVAFYRLLIQHRDRDKVLAELKYWEHDPEQNPKLIPYVNEHLDQLAEILAARGVISQHGPEGSRALIAKR